MDKPLFWPTVILTLVIIAVIFMSVIAEAYALTVYASVVLILFVASLKAIRWM